MSLKPIRLDRILETCFKQKADSILLIDGSPPLMSMNGNLRSLETYELDAHLISALIHQIPLETEAMPDEDGYIPVNFTYGTCRFQGRIFQQMSPPVVILIRSLVEDQKPPA